MMADHDQLIDPKDIEALTAGLLAALDTELAGINARADQARRTLEHCETERETVTRKRETVLQAQALQLDFLNRQKPSIPPLPPIPQRPMTFAGGGDAKPLPPLPPPPVPRRSAFVFKPNPKRARIGPQRYFILTDIHQNGPTTVEEIAVRTELSLKRIKDQVRADLTDGMLDEVLVHTSNPVGVPKLRLTSAGGDLLRRFLEYRQNNKIPLPTKEEALGQQETEGVFS